MFFSRISRDFVFMLQVMHSIFLRCTQTVSFTAAPLQPTVLMPFLEKVCCRIGSRYQDASSNNYCKCIIIRFTTFRHRTMFYRAKNKLKRGMKIKLDLTKSRYNLLKRANDHVKEVLPLNFAMLI